MTFRSPLPPPSFQAPRILPRPWIRLWVGARGWVVSGVALVLVVSGVFWPPRPPPPPDPWDAPVAVAVADFWTPPGNPDARRETVTAPAPPDEEELARLAQIQTPEPPPGTVRLAAVQMSPRLGDTQGNLAVIATLARRAAAGGARIVTFPEGSVTGWADPSRNRYWVMGPDAGDGRSLPLAAEVEGGSALRRLGALSKELGIWLAVSLLEAEERRYYSTAFLLNPEGEVAARARRRDLDPDFDTLLTAGDPHAPEAVADTPWGRVGLLPRYDAFRPERLDAMKEAGVFLILNPNAMILENAEALLADRRFWQPFSERGLSLALANWTAPDWSAWEGWGLTRIHRPDNHFVRTRHDGRPDIVILDLPVPDPDASGEAVAGGEGN